MEAESCTFLPLRHDNSTDPPPSNRKTTHGAQQHTCMKTHQWMAGQEWVSLGETGEYTGKNSHWWRAQWNVLSWRKGEKICKCQSKEVDFSQAKELPVCVLLALIPPSHCLISSLWITPLPQSCFSLLVQEFVGRLLKNKIKHSYLQMFIRHRTWDACVYTAFTDWAQLVQLIIG